MMRPEDVPAELVEAAVPLGPPRGECPLSDQREGEHSWRFDGDDPYIICVYCGELQDALTGRIVTAGRTA